MKSGVVKPNRAGVRETGVEYGRVTRVASRVAFPEQKALCGVSVVTSWRTRCSL